MILKKATVILCFLLAVTFNELEAQTLDGQLKKLSDAPTDSVHHGSTNQVTYDQVLQQWKTISDVTHWIGENFRYDMDRAKQLAENSPTREKISIYTPAELYQAKNGVCIDLSRFATETINLIDSSKHVQYLMIEFEPLVINGSIIKKHWMAVYQDSSGYHFLADSKRPGYVVGSYKNVEDFITEYQAFRERKIVSWKILMSYERKFKKKKIQESKE